MLISLLASVVLVTPSTSFLPRDDPPPAQQSQDSARIAELERALAAVQARLTELERSRADEAAARTQERAAAEAQAAALLDEIDALKKAGGGAGDSWRDRLTVGGYGEFHVNLPEGHGGDQFDIHRFVLYLGWRFEDWIQLYSETEIEHGFVEDDNGEIAIEQLYLDFLLNQNVNIRVGRLLAPLGIVNQRHEPTTFNGVERPAFETFVIPTTWWLDGAGVWGEISPSVKYQLYLSGGLDGTGFDSIEGIRGGRLEERPSAHDLALSGRVDWYTGGANALRLGLSGFGGGLDNGDEGADPGVDADIAIVSADAEYQIGRFDFRGVWAFEKIDGARDLSTVTGVPISSEIDGWYVEAAYHWLPESWKTGRMERADAIVFARYDDVDTQRDVPSGLTADPAGDRNEITLGLSYFPTTNVVLKADYRIRNDDSSADLPEQLDFGVGFRF